jgi:hypothetical protein
MKALAGKYSITAFVVLGLVVGLAGPAWAAPAPACDEPSLPPDLVVKARTAQTYPTFCSIPPTPTGIRTGGEFKTAVVGVRVAGARLVEQTGPETFSLAGTEAFAAAAKRDAIPPPPMATPDEAPTEEFINKLKARAAPPPRKR